VSVVVPDLPPTPTSLTVIPPAVPPPAAPAGESIITHLEAVEPMTSPPEPELNESTRFRIVRPFARGGQGHIYIARDEQLGREVALKELRPRHAERPASRVRFVREAEIAGGLEHPGVVPVYALGKHPDGRPFYAMRFIQGRTFHEVVGEYHHPPDSWTAADRNVRFRQLLQRFVSVCQTIAFAHSRGIIHRDIKPANVLIGSYGEAVVVDWGLARPYHPDAGCSGETEEALSMTDTPPPAHVDSTLMGSALGTPAFMSPEQADGLWDRVNPASDIYSLGATLYVLLTGKPPLPQQAFTEMARKIRAGKIKPPRQLKPETPRALEAICLKAMAVNPAERYSSALGLAEDIEHWLADEQVQAWDEPVLERARRWIRRHRTLVAAIAALWITGGVALGVGLVIVNGEKQRTELARLRTRAALDRQTAIIDDWLSRQRELLPYHREILRKTLADYEQLTADAGRDPESRFGVVQAYRRVGEIQSRLGELGEAELAMVEADRRLQELTAELPGESELQRERARILTGEGVLARARGEPQKAERLFTDALAIRRAFAAAEPEDLDALQELAKGHANVAAALADLNRPSADQAFREALRLRQVVADRTTGPSEAEQLADQELAKAHRNLGRYLFNKACEASPPPDHNPLDSPEGVRLAAEAEQALRAAAGIGERLVRDAEGVTGNHEELAEACLRLGTKFVKERKPKEAAPWLSRAAEQFDRLTTLHPTVPEYRRELAGVRYQLGQLALGERPAEALQQFDGSLETAGEYLRRGQPKSLIQNTIMADHVGRAIALDRLGRHADAADAWTQAIALQADANKKLSYRSLRAFQMAKAGQTDAALSEVADLSGRPNAGVDALYNCACVYAQSIPAAPAREDELTARAVGLLRRAKDAGAFTIPKRLKNLDSDADLNPIRKSEAFRKFRAELPS
jgi:serine/threonine-protein kinase